LHCVLVPHLARGGNRRRNDWDADDLAQWLAHKTPPDTLVLGTTDLIHFGPQFGSDPGSLPYPQQLSKTTLEAPLLDGLAKVNPEAVDHALAARQASGHGVADAPDVLGIVVRTAEAIGAPRGRVVDYFDSSSVEHPLASAAVNGTTMPRTDIPTGTRLPGAPCPRSLSYVGIVYDPPSSTPARSASVLTALTPFDIMQAIGAVRSVVALRTAAEASGSSILSGADQGTQVLAALMPPWSVWREFVPNTWGVFVGSAVHEDKTNCSYGRFPDDPSSVADKIVRASGNCIADARDRWRIPYTVGLLEDWGALKFKVELLEPETSWRWVSPASVLATTRSGHARYAAGDTVSN